MKFNLINLVKKMSSGYIIVANVFGRLCLLWRAMSFTYKWAESNYDMTFWLCVGLTDLHIRFHHLWVCDDNLFKSYDARLSTIWENIIEKRPQTQSRYREKAPQAYGFSTQGPLQCRNWIYNFDCVTIMKIYFSIIWLRVMCELTLQLSKYSVLLHTHTIWPYD